MPENKHLRLLLGLIYITLGALGLYFALPWFLPFLLAMGFAALLERPVRFFMRRLNMPRWVSSALCCLLVGLVLAGLLAMAAWRLWYEVTLLLDRLPTLLSALPSVGSAWESWVYRFITAAPLPMQGYLSSMLDGLIAQGLSLPGQLYGVLLGWLTAAAQGVPSAFLFFFTTAVAIYFTSAARPAITAFLRRQLPAPWRPKLRRGMQRMRATFGGWLRAQGLLMLVTFGELTVGFLVLGVDYFLLLAALVALVDALPVFGTGTVLIPWAAVAALSGDWTLAIGLLILYWVVGAVRGILEPKLVGDRVGLPPLVALMSMYVGFQVFGVAGMVLAPLGAMFLKELHDCGFLRLWRD